MRDIATAGLLAMILMTGCGQPPPAEQDSERPPGVEHTARRAPALPSPPTLTTAPPKTATVADAWDLGGDASGVESVNGMPLALETEGPWQIRRPARSRADDSSYGLGGLGLVGTGRGGGGTGEGSIGLGSIGSIGRGGGGGSGSGYGRGSGALARPKRSAKPARPTPSPSKAGYGAGPDKSAKQAPVGPLKAGATDDNADLKGFLAYLDGARKTLRDRFEEIDVRGRTLIRVVDRGGRPIPGAQVRLVNKHQRELWRATTYGDGRAPVYQGMALRSGQGQDDPRELALVVDALGAQVTEPWPGPGEALTITAPVDRAPSPLVVEVLFIIDTTGSMGDEIAQIKATLLAVTDRIRRVDAKTELRYGAVLYRDISDSYVTMQHPFTEDIQAFDAALRKIDANGGGDYPESVNQGLAQAVQGMQWQPSSAKVAFLIGDAPPHMDYKGEATYGESARQAVALGIRIHAVAASGLDPLGSVVFRQVAQLTRGKFIFIEYGKDLAGSAAKHGVTKKDLNANNLDTIIFDQIREEIRGWGAR